MRLCNTEGNADRLKEQTYLMFLYREDVLGEVSNPNIYFVKWHMNKGWFPSCSTIRGILFKELCENLPYWPFYLVL